MGVSEREQFLNPGDLYPTIDLSIEEEIEELKGEKDKVVNQLTALYDDHRSSRPVLAGRYVNEVYNGGLFDKGSEIISIKEDSDDPLLTIALKSAWEGIVIVSHLPILAEMTLVEGLDKDSKFLEDLGIPIETQENEKECFEFLKASAKKLRDDHTGFLLVDGFCDGSIPDPNKTGHKAPQAFFEGAQFARRLYKEVYPLTSGICQQKSKKPI